MILQVFKHFRPQVWNANQLIFVKVTHVVKKNFPTFSTGAPEAFQKR